MPNYWDIVKKAISDAVGNAVGAVPQAGISLAGGLAQKQASQLAPGVSVPNIANQPKRIIGDIANNMATKAVNTATKPAEVVRLDTRIMHR